MKRFSISVQVETAIAVALAIVLSYIKFFQMPQGGSVSLQMVPIVLLAVRRGPKVGLLGGLLFGVLKSMLNPSFYVDPVQHILDYPVAFTVIGLVGLWVKYGKTRKDLIGNAAAVCFVFGLRFLVHVLSGKIFFRNLCAGRDESVVVQLDLQRSLSTAGNDCNPGCGNVSFNPEGSG